MPRLRDPRGHYLQTTRLPADTPHAAPEAAETPPEAEAQRAEEQRPQDQRPEGPRAESARERAARRTAEIVGHLEGALDESQDELSLDSITIPEDWSYEWKRQTVYGKTDPAYDTRLARTGWEAVPASRHPHMMPKGHRGEITRDGLVLMERPKVVTQRVQQIMYERARGAVRLKERQLNEAPDGTFDRVDERGRPAARVRTTHSPVEIPVPNE